MITNMNVYNFNHYCRTVVSFEVGSRAVNIRITVNLKVEFLLRIMKWINTFINI